jgi:monofunctional biosynthetic peptidoglycan transglycosylase
VIDRNLFVFSGIIMGKNTFLQRMFKRIKKLLIILFVAHLIYIVVLKWIDPPITITQVASVIEGHGLKRDYIPMQDISPHARLAVIASEDQLFPGHSGFDVKSIEKVITQRSKKAGRMRGASTISQQVAKNVFLWQGRSWIRKGIEAYFTFMIEKIWGKERILEVYLNVAEMGSGIFGIEAASQEYFNKPAKKLSRKEAAMIAAALPNPKTYIVKPPSRYVSQRYLWIMSQMHNLENKPEIELLIAEEKKVVSRED